MTFLTCYNGIFNITNKNNKFYLAKSFLDKNVCVSILVPHGTYEFEFLNDEIRILIFEEGHFIEIRYTFTKKPSSQTLGSIIETSRQEPLISFDPDNSIRDRLSFSSSTIYEG